MNKFFLIALLLFIAPAARSQGFYLGAAAGIGLTSNPNARYFPGLEVCFLGGITAGLILSPEVDVYSGLGLSAYSYSIPSVNSNPSSPQTLRYTEIPLAVRFAFSHRQPGRKPIRYRSHRPPGPPDLWGGHPPEGRFYLEAGMITGLLSQARFKQVDNSNNFYRASFKPMIGFGVLVGGHNRVNGVFGGQFLSAFTNEYRGNQTGSASGNFSLTSFVLKLGLQVRLGN